jgi:trehalose utilization protein
MTRPPVRVTVWGENVHEHEMPEVRRHYPNGMHETIAEGLRRHPGDGVEVRTTTLQQLEHGLTDEILASTDVLTWWGHAAHGQVADEVVARVQRHVLAGMGLLVLHSGHESKIFKSLMGTSCSLHWRDAGEREIVWTVNPAHPITRDLPEAFIVPRQEMYGEYFDIPQPDELIFISSFSGGEVFRSGCCFHRGAGRIFYFSPGHETYPIYHQPEIQRVLSNGVMWAYRGRERRLPTEKGPMPEGWFEGS